MKTLEEAEALAHAMVSIGNNVGRNTMAIISDMSQPLGRAIGNALELKEAIETLKAKGQRFNGTCINIRFTNGSVSSKAQSLEEARQMLEEAIQSGKALEKFKTFISHQGGDSSIVDDPDKLPHAKYQIHFQAKRMA